MSKSWLFLSCVGLSVMLNGCGGSSGTHAAPATNGGAVLSQYQATLPDGSQMELEIFGNDAMGWSGTFAVAAVTGPYAFQSGSFIGTASGNSLNADCETATGVEFQLTGTSNGDASFTLTRSDIPGAVLTFTPVTQAALAPRGTATFILNTSGSTAQAALSTAPFSVQGGGTMAGYRGTWNGVNLTLWSYSSGYASIVVQVNDSAIYTVNFAKYTIADFPTATLSSPTAGLQIYSPVTKTMHKFGSSGKVSPG